MRFWLISLLLLSGCQTTRQQSEISFMQFKIYATQEVPKAQWSSRARNAALGSPRPSLSMDQPRDLFGMKFNEAKDKVVIVDVRSASEFNIASLKTNPNVKTNVVNIPMTSLTSTQSLAVKKSAILFVVADTRKNAEEAFKTFRQLGYSQSLYFADDYSKLPKMREEKVSP